jgi:pimeloyl-ACP methyl ester carboxylesterase
MQYVDDLNAALAWVMKQPELTDSKRIGFLGLSVGGMSAVMGARQHQEVRSLILWGTLPRYSVAKQDRIRDVIESAWRASDRSLSQSEFFEAYDLIDPIDHVAQLSQPILFAGGLKDTTYFVRGEQAEFLAAATLSSTTMMLKVANESHKLHHSAAHFPALARIFSAWFVGSVAAGVPKAE